MIEAKELLDVRATDDGRRLRVRMRDSRGETVLVTLPTCWLGALVSARFGRAEEPAAEPVDGWTVRRSSDGQDVVLTLCTPEGQAHAFTLKPWQIEGIATLAAHGGPARPASRMVH